MLNWLGVKPLYSRPRVSDDNANAESLFRTAKSVQSSLPRGSLTCKLRATGPLVSFIGKTSIIALVVFDMCRRLSAMTAIQVGLDDTSLRLSSTTQRQAPPK